MDLTGREENAASCFKTKTLPVCLTVEFQCEDNQFRCTDGLCIPASWQCDGDKDCSDYTDELDCIGESMGEGGGLNLILTDLVSWN